MLCAAFCIIIWLVQDKNLYYPGYSEKADAFLAEQSDTFQRIVIEGKNENTYSGWMKKAFSESDRPDAELSPATILFFGGNGMSSALTFTNLEEKELWSSYTELQFIMIDYPGYGRSTGRPSEKTICEMALDTYDYVSGMEDTGEVFVMGFSYGTFPAAFTAARRDADGLILLAPFDNGTNLINKYFNIFHGPLKLLVKNKLESDKYAAGVTEPTLIVVSDSDKVIVNRLSENLSDSFPVRPEYIAVSGLTHNEVFYDSDVIGYIIDFIEQKRQP
jgi:pimeloyl-ACP methyl ester carboxylesterase